MPSSHSAPRYTDKGPLAHGGGAAGRGSRSGIACRVQMVFFLVPALAVIVYCGALFATSVAFPLENLARAASTNPEGFVAHANVQMLVGNVFDALLFIYTAFSLIALVRAATSKAVPMKPRFFLRVWLVNVALIAVACLVPAALDATFRFTYLNIAVSPLVGCSLVSLLFSAVALVKNRGAKRRAERGWSA